MKKFLDLVASFALVFNVDWNEDYEDDAYVLAKREEELNADTPVITVVTAPVTSRAV